ncbi:MAG: DNA polymerase III subunit beta [Myxococcales bacterium]|nr:DNA polymerase III subunit beta [Myxococcales bacterium]
MDVTLPKKDLIRLFGRTQGVADKKSTMPILSNALVMARGGSIRASATDLFMAVTSSQPATIQRDGLIALPAKELVERLKAMPEGLVQFSVSEGSTVLLKAVGAKREFRLRGMPGEDFPTLPQPDESSTELAISPAILADLIAKTSFSISPDETRPHLNSALLEWDGAVARMVTTDGHRLSKYEIDVPGVEAKFSLLIPLKGIGELRRLCDELRSDKSTDAPIKLLRGGPNVFFSYARPGEESLLAIKLVDAQFPPYQQVIPQRSDHSARVSRASFIDALRAMSIAASERTGSVKISLAGGTMRVSSENPDSGDALDELAVEYAGPDMTIGFNVRYLLDVLTVIDAEDVKLGLSGELDPVVVSPASDARFLGIVMPMRI